jgi:hypothetical protein
MGQDTSKVSPPPPPPPPPIVDDREDCVLSPILYVVDDSRRVRLTHHILFHKPTKNVYFIEIPNPTADDSIGLSLDWKKYRGDPIHCVVPGLDGYSVVCIYRYTLNSGVYCRRFERLSNGMILRDGFMGSCIDSELTPKDFLNRRPFVPVGDPRYDALACLF